MTSFNLAFCQSLQAINEAKPQKHGPLHRYLGPPAPPACTKAIRRSIEWGAATAAYQIEGGWDEGGKSNSVWDVWSQTPGKVAQNQTGNTACDHYHRWREDVQLMQQLGLKHYRLSFSWPRIVPGGVAGSPANPEGLHFYKQLLSSLRAAGIAPLVTLFHWDLPQVLQDDHGGLLGEQFPEHFAYYADVVFRELGRFVSHWVTLNEPLVTCSMGYQSGVFPSGLQLGTQAFLQCGHNQLKAHAKAVQLYRQRYSRRQKGHLSLAVPGWWMIPYDASSKANRAAAARAMEFRWGWMFDPVITGDYPTAMRAHFDSQLPAFSAEGQQLLKGSVDFLGVNIYTARYVADGSENGMPWVESLTNASGAALCPDSDELCLAVAQDGVNVQGFYAWSLMDNFEWADGYRPRFGLVYVDYENGLRRLPKRSAAWMARHFFLKRQLGQW
ncbi:hypothetical protein OEZ85_007598 [Tetradesmus obliquus]|uniref:Beta-glucosidase n=1 Tax=Tetradesmus obliquus TaxID=3088 RepID=A0ABY8TGQ8_TETOB|nr:hypothetical protein OEZ85_007598 [Tetradesmus obliquus]